MGESGLVNQGGNDGVVVGGGGRGELELREGAWPSAVIPLVHTYAGRRFSFTLYAAAATALRFGQCGDRGEEGDAV